MAEQTKEHQVVAINISENNWLGRGNRLNFEIEVDQESLIGNISYANPNYDFLGNSISYFLSNERNDKPDQGYENTLVSTGIRTGFEQYKNIFTNLGLTASYDDLRTLSTASSSLKKQEGSYTDLYFDYGLNYDLRNSRYKPSSGNQTRFFQELPLVSDNQEISNTLIFTQFKKLSNTSDMVGKASIYLKAVNALESDSDVRISNRGSVPYSRLRGFEKGKIGPKDGNEYIGGNYVSSLNLSSNLPFILPTVETLDFSIFIDAANVWGVDYDSNIDDSNSIRSSTGVGVNLLTPVGPLSFSLSQPITKKSTDKTESFRFNLGTTF